MKKYKTKTLAIAALAVATMLTTKVHASTQDARSSWRSDVAATIAKEFNLDQSKVESVLTKIHAQKRQERKAKHAERVTQRLDELVKQGTITQAQKDLLLKKLTEMRAQNKKAYSSEMTPDQRKTIMQQHKSELEAWAASQGISADVLQQIRPGRHFKQ